MKIWVIGSKAAIASNGHEYMKQPLIAFHTESEADAACDMVQKISGERPMKADAALMRTSVVEPPQ